MSHSHQHEGHEGAAQHTAPATVNVEIAGLTVTLPVKFTEGHRLTENQAKVLDAAYQRQFTNNQNAMAKSRAEKFEKADDNDKGKFSALTATDLATIYADYEPSIGGIGRMGSMEKLRYTAGWKAWVALVTEHNESIKSGGSPVITKAGTKPVNIDRAPSKTKDMSEADHKIEVETFQEGRKAFVSRLWEHSVYGPLAQAQLDLLLAERGKKDEVDAVDSGEDLL